MNAAFEEEGVYMEICFHEQQGIPFKKEEKQSFQTTLEPIGDIRWILFCGSFVALASSPCF